jgi:ATP-dependent helicase/nuclease subunit B
VHLNPLLEQGVVALTASRRLAHAMRLRYAQYAQDKGLTVWRTPQVLPWSAWVRQQRLTARATEEGAFHRLLSPAQMRVLWDDVVTTSNIGRELLAPSQAARLAARSWQRLHDYLIPLDRLEQFESPEAQALLSWGREFARRCAALQAIDDVRLSHWMFDSGFMPSDRLVFAGFDVLVPAVQRLVDRWSEAGRIEVASESAGEGEIEVVAAADAADEIELAAQWARSQLEAGVGDIGVIVSDLPPRREEVRRVFEKVFAPGQRHTHVEELSVPVVIAAPAPLNSYPLVDAAVLVLRMAVGQGDATLAGRLLRSPFIAGAEEERGRRALADLRLRDEQRDRWDWSSFERWAAVTQCEGLSLLARELTPIVRAGFSAASPSEWAERLQTILLRIGWPGDRTLTSVEHQTLAKFQDTLAEFGSLDAVARHMSARQALHRFQELLRDTPFEPETANASVTVIDAMTSSGMQFDALWVVGLQADRMPAPSNPDPLIPLELQRAAGMPEATAGGALQASRLQLNRWLRSARSIVLSWPERDGDAELTVSPLIAQFRAGARIAKTTPSLRESLFGHRPVLELLRDDRAPPLTEGTASGGAAILELQSRCPFKAHAQLRLKAQPLSRVSLGVEPADRGGILHSVLQDIWGLLGSQDTLLSMRDEDLEARVREAAQRCASAALQPDSRVSERLAALEIESTVRQVMTLLAIEKQRPPFRVRFAEASERYSIGGLNVTLRPDRIDELSEGGELLIDYKLGASHLPSHWLDRTPLRPRSPQLPLYGLAHGAELRALAFVVLAAGRVEYRGWSDGAQVAPGVDPYPPKRLRVDLGDPMDWQALLDQWHFTLTRLAQRFVAGEAPVDPLQGECDHCHLSTLCRIHEIGTSERGEINDE